jgi:hypothetical protein
MGDKTVIYLDIPMEILIGRKSRTIVEQKNPFSQEKGFFCFVVM